MAAYNKYQYETSPRKLEPDYKQVPKKYPKKSTAKNKQTNGQEQKKEQKKLQRKVVLYIAVIFGVLFAISYRNAVISEEFSQIKSLKSDLTTIQKENEQLEVNIESSLNLNNIEEIAKNELGMRKLTNDQTIYISYPKQDYIEAASEEVKLEESENLIQQIISKIFR